MIKTKLIIGLVLGVFQLTMVEILEKNKIEILYELKMSISVIDVAFGLVAIPHWPVNIFLPFLILFFILLVLVKFKKTDNRNIAAWNAVMISMLAGGVSNLIEILVKGYVCNIFAVRVNMHSIFFTVGDAYAFVVVILIVADYIKTKNKNLYCGDPANIDLELRLKNLLFGR